MQLSALSSFRTIPAPWETGDKIPWNNAEFSQRMLASHLSQDHDWASRRSPIIAQHVRWIDQALPIQARILDLGCGPGLYTQRLAALGHACVGVDFSPASIDYARTQADERRLAIDYYQEDIREFFITEPFDLIMMTFGEFNVFRPEEIENVVKRALAGLKKDGMLLVETHTWQAVETAGMMPPSWEYSDSGVFSDRPHLLLQEHFWDREQAATVTRYFVVDGWTGAMEQYGTTMQAYDESTYRRLLGEEEGYEVSVLSEEDWPTGDLFQGKLKTFLSRKKES